MKTQRFLIWTSSLLLAGALSVSAGEKSEITKKTAAQTDQAQITQSAAKTALKNQTNCPVMGGVIDSAAFTDIQGQRVYHCCPMCTKKLTAEPESFFQQAAKDGILFENIQTKCPVSDMKLNDSIFTDYVGRRIYFGSEECRDTFLKDPVKYLSQIKDNPGSVEKPMKMDMKMNMKMKETANGETSKNTKDR